MWDRVVDRTRTRRRPQLPGGTGLQVYGPAFNRRRRPHKPTRQSDRVDETDLKVKNQERDLYCAVDSVGRPIDFLLIAQGDAAAAQRFRQKVFRSPVNVNPRVVNVEKTVFTRPPYQPGRSLECCRLAGAGARVSFCIL